MKRMIVFLMTFGCIFAGASLAAAQPTPEATSTTSKVTEHNFSDGDNITGEFQTPGSIVITSRQKERLKSLIFVRVTFKDALIESAEDL